MTSVLYSSGLNYQGRNPMGNELRGLERRVQDIEGAFGGVKTSMESFIASQAKPAVPAGPSEADKKIAELQILIESLQTSLESYKTLVDILKTRVDKADAAIASASAAASQAKTIAMAAAADAASAAASAAAASAIPVSA